MGKLVRCITTNGEVMISCVDTTDVVEKYRSIHHSTPVVTAATGRLMTAGVIMGNMLKSKDHSITLQVKGDGPIGGITCVGDSNGDVKAYAENPFANLPLNKYNKLDVGGAVGNGSLYVIKDEGLKQPYCGVVPLVSGEIAEDITSYYATSEQIPTVCSLGVLVNSDCTVAVAGGFILQLLPAASSQTISKVEEAVKKLSPVTTMLSEGDNILDIVAKALDGFEFEELYRQDVFFKCDCSYERVKRALFTLPKEDLLEMEQENPIAELSCHFCNKKYKYDLREINN